MDADDALAGARPGRDVELLAAPDVDRRVLRVSQMQRVSRDGAKERHRLGLAGDLRRDPLEAAADTERALGASLLRAVAVDGRGEDEHGEADDHDLGAEALSDCALEI